MAATILGELRRPVADSVRAAAQEVRRRHGASLVACLFYGSCLRDGRDEGRVIDFYAIAEDYRRFHGGWVPAALNAALPPNVYYLETPFEDRIVRAKYAVVSLAHLIRHTSPAAFQASLWGRLAQPCALVYARDPAVEETVAGALAAAVETLAGETLALMPGEFTPDQLWTRAFRESYATELRAERSNRPRDLYRAYAERYDGMTVAALSGIKGLEAGGAARSIRHPASTGRRRLARLRWAIRRVLGKTAQVLRLLKAAYTFSDGLDYILWKIEKHSGVRATPTPWQRRHPLLAAPSLAWRLYRLGAFR